MRMNLQARALPASAGWLWLRDGFALFRRQPFAVMTLFLTLLFATLVLAMIPLVGAVVATILYPGLTVAFMVACRRIVRHELVLPTVLVAPFRDDHGIAARPLMVLGVLFFAMSALAMALTVLIAGDTAMGMLVQGQRAPELPIDSPEFLRVWMLVVGFQLAIAILFWFAPVLVAWHGVSPLKALFFSVVAVRRNLRAFAVFGATIGAVIFFMATALVVLISAIDVPPSFDFVLMVPLSVAIASIVECASYVSYRSTFALDDDRRTGAQPD